jgi:glucokinase
MLLAGDIGGTKTNLAIIDPGAGFPPEADFAPWAEATFKSADYPSLKAVVTEFLSDTRASVDSAVFGVAGPVVDGQSTTTNLPWSISEEALRETLGLEEVRLLNDLETTAHGVLHLPGSDLASLNESEPRRGTRAIIAPGTGLGEAILLYHEGHYHILASEGGHADFGPNTLFEIELLRHLLGRFGHVSYERICSGMGLPLIYDYLRENRFAEEKASVVQALREASDPTPVIVQAAMAQESDLCIAALNHFVSILGAEAGNLALKVMATGGIYVGGGIPPRILPKLKDGTFMASFVNKGRFADTLSHVPVCVILNPKTALLGAAACGLGLEI